MKKTLFLALMLVIGATAFAQQSMATLNHNDTITVFYGNYALRDAHNAAVAGDIVTLSPGSFEKFDITKPITLRGAGYENDTVSNIITSTIIDGTFDINVPDSSIKLEVEGVIFDDGVVCFRANDAKFIKCIFNEFSSYRWENSYGSFENLSFINCLVRKIDISGPKNDENGNSIYSINSVMRNVSLCRITSNSGNSSTSVLYAYNSIISFPTNVGHRYGGFEYLYNSICYNISDIDLMQNCIIISARYTGPNNQTNTTYDNLNEVFETWHSCTGNEGFSFDERYILKEEIATSFLGSDGTEVGIHGGMFPFDTRPSYMVVKKCNVANKSTIDGKLSVDIEVMVEE